MSALANFGGMPVTTCRVAIGAYGIPWHEVECVGDTTVTGAQTLTLDDLTLAVTVVTGGVINTRQRYRVVAGAGGWGKVLPARSYANDAGVRLADVIRDAAAACGETIGTIDPTINPIVGPAFVRPLGPASRVLELLVPQNYYVDEKGLTNLGRRPAVPYTGQALGLTNDPSQSRYDLVPPDGGLSALLPGAVVNGVEAVDVEHAIGDDGALSSTIWGRGIANTTRLSEAFRRIVETFTASMRFFAPYEYRIVQVSGSRLDLQIVRTSTGMPDLRGVPTFPATTYADTTPPFAPGVAPQLGSTCVVSFLNGDPSRPQIMARSGDPVLIGATAIAASAITTASGAPITKSLVGRIGVGA